MIFSLDVRRARKGDCLLLHYGTKAKRGLIMIDGGPRGVYAPHLKPRLQQIKTALGLSKQQPLPVDLMMVSHVDDDHIVGILECTKELIEAKEAHQPPLLRALGLWHNSFDEIIGNTPKELTASLTAQFGATAATGDLPEDATLDEAELEQGTSEETVVDSLKVLASIEQGHRLRTDADKLDIPLNPEFDSKLIIASDDQDVIDMSKGLEFTIVGPLKPEVLALQKKHDAWLKKLREQGLSPSAALAAYVDKSVHNLSSIVVHAKVGNKTMLLTGDARGDKVLKGLEVAGLLDSGADSTMHVDILKVPHHGSANNLDTDFFERVTADHYVFSGNGEHGNPEREALEMLFEVRGKKPLTIHLTYPIDEIDVEREKDWKKEQKKEKKKKETNPNKKVRPNWSPKKHSLKAFFDDNPLARGQKLRIVDETAPHLIELSDPTGL